MTGKESKRLHTISEQPEESCEQHGFYPIKTHGRLAEEERTIKSSPSFLLYPVARKLCHPTISEKLCPCYRYTTGITKDISKEYNYITARSEQDLKEQSAFQSRSLDGNEELLKALEFSIFRSVQQKPEKYTSLESDIINNNNYDNRIIMKNKNGVTLDQVIKRNYDECMKKNYDLSFFELRLKSDGVKEENEKLEEIAASRQNVGKKLLYRKPKVAFFV